ncbi:GNAT superfamily N-acetyltransferase [Lipingzhangella halophila]|uniref:GNAT superfamily N-acetyltransferase n=1 Tax=Lipingzhangella halophila TaxID=1783352 RepID=A0A7W7RGS3_9ACTN|nr:GNAT family N-acetyltransferase [Lipingzhangella halophila]MBB4931697.1 GNAT superfamily N-acetyltransferase [Lipingzhangella halophila]
MEQFSRMTANTEGSAADVERIERHAIGAWPAPATHCSDGWLLRHTPGMRRLRSGNTALPPSPDGAGRSGLAVVEAFYRDRGLPAAIQVSPAAQHTELDAYLAGRGYRFDTPVHVLTASAEPVATAPQPAAAWTVHLDDAPTAPWLAAFVELDAQHDSRAIADQVIAKISLPAAYVRIDAGHRTAGIGVFVGGDDRWAGVYCMATHPEHRRRGVAAAVLRAGARWAAERGIAGLYLQVAQSNTAAHTLYTRTGFTPAYSYHYRIRHTGAEPQATGE